MRGDLPARLRRFAPLAAIITVVVLLAAGIGLAVYIDRSNQLEDIEEITVQARTLAMTVTAALTFNDHEAAAEYTDAVRANPNVEQAAIYDANHQLFAVSSEQGSSPPPPVFRLQPPTISNGHLIVTEPVLVDQKQIGGVYIRSTIESLGSRLQRYGLIVLLASMAALFVAMLGLAQRELTRANAILANQAGNLAAANASLRDQIAQREKAEAALRQAQKMEAIGQLTGGVAHDFNNLLQVIMGNLERLLRHSQGLDASAEFTRMVSSAARAAERAATLTQRLLAFSRRQPLMPKPLDVNKLVSGLLDLITRTIGESIQVQTRLGGGVWHSFADENQLENALLNLTVNARDAMPNGGQLIIETSNASLGTTEIAAFPEEDARPGDYVLISVTDTGTGMSPEVLSHVFEPFFTTKDIGQGTGLGLSQVYGFVRQSDGLIQIDSEIGHGTQVNIYLPRLEIEENVADGPAGSVVVPTGQVNESILVVEDQHDVRAFTAETLRELGYDVTEVSNGQDALMLVRQNPIALLLTDIGLPGALDGRALAAEALRLRPDLKVLFATGYSSTIVHHGRMDSGLEVISKPFTRRELGYRVRAILDREPAHSARETG